MNNFEQQIWAAVFGAEYIRFRAISEQLHHENPKRYVSPDKACGEHGAANIAMEAVLKIRKLQESEDAPYLFLEKE